MRLQPGDAVNLLSGERRPAQELHNVVAMAGIGHPPRFFATLRQCGVTPVNTVGLADHAALAEEDVVKLLEKHQTLLMTEKDAVKCRAFAAGHENWWYLPVDAYLAQPQAEQLLQTLVALVK